MPKIVLFLILICLNSLPTKCDLLMPCYKILSLSMYNLYN